MRSVQFPPENHFETLATQFSALEESLYQKDLTWTWQMIFQLRQTVESLKQEITNKEK